MEAELTEPGRRSKAPQRAGLCKPAHSPAGLPYRATRQNHNTYDMDTKLYSGSRCHIKGTRPANGLDLFLSGMSQVLPRTNACFSSFPSLLAPTYGGNNG